ncbi:MAG: hypothetical protein JW795_08640 [Chitinivibrionales bacterium]|nr:hypothetical protein [Chitinivibrionales bacterium]
MDKKEENRDMINKRITSRYCCITEYGIIDLNMSNHSEVHSILAGIGDEWLHAYVQSEELHDPAPASEPPSRGVLRDHQLAGHEPSSDSGHMRFYPDGSLLFNLLADWACQIALQRMGAVQIETPLLYDWADPAIRQQAGSFHEQHYSVRVPDDPERKFVLRFAGDFGLFSLMRTATLSHRHMPIRIYEFSKSFRYERRGALSGIRRLRAFHMPDIHSFCADQHQGLDEYEQLFTSYVASSRQMNIPFCLCLRTVEEYWNRHKERIVAMQQRAGKPAFVEILSEMKHYWVLKHELQAIDSLSGAVQLSTVQLDIKDGDLYGIRYRDENDQARACTICHSSIGSIERWIYILLEEALRHPKPQLPLWLAPTQLRLIPVSDGHISYCQSCVIPGIRMDIDDRKETVGRKIADANRRWLPYVAVAGDAEAASGTLSLTERSSGRRWSVDRSAIESLIRKETESFPFRPLPGSVLMSKRPVFH